MNFVAHYVAAEHLGLAAQVGSVLPDLWGVYTRKFRIQHLRQSLLSFNDVLLGIDYHHFIDKKFHQHSLFTHNQSRLRRYMTTICVQRQGLRLFFVSHILLELYLDHLLLKAEQNLSQTVIKTTTNLINTIAETTQGEVLQFCDFAVEFIPKVMIDYQKIDGLGLRLNRIMDAMQQSRLTATELVATFDYLEGLQTDLNDELQRFLSLSQKDFVLSELA